MSQNYYSNTQRNNNACQICKIKEPEPLVQLGDFCYLCSLCNTKRGQRWTFSDAWKYRYANGYKNKSTYERRDKCYYCGNLDYLVDIFDKKHPNLMHSYRGHQECAYCKYEREVVNPRHDQIMSRPKHYDAEFYEAHTFRSEGTGSGLDVDKSLRRVAAETEKRTADVDRRRAAWQAFVRKTE